MSYLVSSSKQSSINKLTRSYDMSLRSLMSEELNVKVQQPSGAGDQTSHEPTSETVAPGHLISPKYNTGKESAGVKLITRPATQPIKKQTTPNKDSGPPQPVKAIHTLPPSLPVSRENTFDSLPPKSPMGSDGDAKDDSKIIDNLVDSLEVSAARVEPTKSAYHRRSASPHRGLSSPHKREPSPHRGLSSPHKREPSPHRVLSSSHKREPSPHRGLSSSHKREPSPYRNRSSPKDGSSLRKSRADTTVEKGHSSPVVSEDPVGGASPVQIRSSASEEEGNCLPSAGNDSITPSSNLIICFFYYYYYYYNTALY